jgi:uncharacterized protein YaeQ
MALKSTIFKANLNVSDLDRQYYGQHALTLARHPSETDQRMMVRLLAFALYADPRLEFGRGLSAEDEPALWQKEYNGDITRWIEVGLPDERSLRKAAGRAGQVVVLAYGRTASLWWDKASGDLERLRNLTVLAVDDEACAGMVELATRSMELQATIQDGQVWLTDGPETVFIEPRILRRS